MGLRITVYLGSAAGKDPAFAEAARELGLMIAEGGHTLVYGGSNVGLMRILAETVLEKGGRVVGIEPEMFDEQGFTMQGLGEFILTKTLEERRTRLIAEGDVLVALPGGLGTLDEITEAVEMASVGAHEKPCILLNVNGYYDALLAFLDEGTAQGFIREGDRALLHCAGSVRELSDFLTRTGLPGREKEE